MDNQDIITFPQFARKIPMLISGVPGLVKGLKVGDTKDKTREVGLGRCIETLAADSGETEAIVDGDRSLSYAEFNAWTNRVGNYLASTGIIKGDAVVVMIENRLELMVALTACAKIGAVSALVNTSQRGRVLTHSINLVEPKAAIVGAELRSAYEEVKTELTVPEQRQFLVDDTVQSGLPPASSHSGDFWIDLMHGSKLASGDNPRQSREIYPDDPCFYIYTSGTTGLPKAVVFNHGRFMKAYGSFGFAAVKLVPSDRMYVCLPFYHATALAVCWGSVLAGGATLVMARRFSASKFWDDIRHHNATAFGYVGELCRYLIERSASPDDTDNRVRVIVGNGLRPSIWKQFKDRFGVPRVMEFYASSEGNIGFSNVLNFDNTVGLCPFRYSIVEYDNEHERPVRNSKGRMIPVGKGKIGLLIGEISEKTPFHGYTDAEKTQKCIFQDVFKPGDRWFNSGDLMRNMGFRHAQFVDRLGDTFRWKGENVSTTEVELIIDGHDSVIESIVYGVEIPNTNGRAGMAWLKTSGHPGQFDFASFLRMLRTSLPACAVPVFLRLGEDAETTGTFKHKKAPLKDASFDINAIDDPVYVWLPGTSTYTRVTQSVLDGINNGAYRF
ncbi:long-chain-acyl-CoA synthetase [Allohahella marinimesophila]|uniref:Long-chain-acyl-CoA synthetase n=1 Tax=Allohahella marinimesophila TaxID=1054972 RepID=A0ABP7PI78_9GAMM